LLSTTPYTPKLSHPRSSTSQTSRKINPQPHLRRHIRDGPIRLLASRCLPPDAKRNLQAMSSGYTPQEREVPYRLVPEGEAQDSQQNVDHYVPAVTRVDFTQFAEAWMNTPLELQELQSGFEPRPRLEELAQQPLFEQPQSQFFAPQSQSQHQQPPSLQQQYTELQYHSLPVAVAGWQSIDMTAGLAGLPGWSAMDASAIEMPSDAGVFGVAATGNGDAPPTPRDVGASDDSPAAMPSAPLSPESQDATAAVSAAPQSPESVVAPAAVPATPQSPESDATPAKSSPEAPSGPPEKRRMRVSRPKVKTGCQQCK
jgi:hypothetical protein